MPFEQWRDQELRPRGLPEYVYGHFLTMAKMHAANRYDRRTHDVEAILGKDPFDRIIAATALIEGLTVISADVAFDAYGLSRLW